MGITTAEAFEKRQVTREDGINVLPRPMITVAALEAGYNLPSPTINEAVATTKYPGQMTCEEFANFCSQHQDCALSAKDMAKAVVVVAPSNVITRGSLESIINQSSSPESALSEEEVDALFQTLDTDHKGAITGDDFMRALYGDEGVLCLHEQRHADAKEGEERIKRIEEENARTAEEDKKKQEEEEAAKKEAEEKEKAEAAEKAAKEKADHEAEASKKKDGKDEKKDDDKDKEKEKKKKAKACC